MCGVVCDVLPLLLLSLVLILVFVNGQAYDTIIGDDCANIDVNWVVVVGFGDVVHVLGCCHCECCCN